MTTGRDKTIESKILLRNHFGVSTRLGKLSENTRCMIEFMLSWRGQNYRYQESFKNNDGSTYSIDTKYKNKFTYLDIPVVMYTKISQNMSLQYGVYTSLFLSGRRVGTTMVTTFYPGASSVTNTFPEYGKYTDKDVWPVGVNARRPVKSFDAGISIGYDFNLKELLAGYVFSIRYSFGLIDVLNNNYPIKNANTIHESHNMLQFTVSYFKF
jgi:hypothetical protein